MLEISWATLLMAGVWCYLAGMVTIMVIIAGLVRR